MDEMKLSSLLTDVKRLISEHEAKYTAKAGFNIFNITRIDTDEWKCCAILRELLNPNGTHGQGAAFLRTFMTDVLRVDDVDSSGFDAAEVVQEQGTDAGRSIDLVIKLGDRRFPIEAKVNATDQEAQLCDYHAYITKEDAAAKIYYLTPDAHQPSESSRGNLVEHEQYERLSWTADVLPWLTAMTEQVRDVPRVRESLAQFAEVLAQMKKYDEGGLMVDIQELVTAENINAIDKLAAAAKAKKEEKLKEAFAAITKQLHSHGHDFQKTVVDGKLHWSYPLPAPSESTLGNFALCLQLTTHLYLGVGSWDTTANTIDVHKTAQRDDYVVSRLKIEKPFRNGPGYVYFNENLLGPDPWTTNYVDLFDATKFNEYVAKAVARVESLMDKWSQQ